VLSIDWEITDEVMTNFVEQIAVLKDRLKDDKIILVFLQLLGSLGEYIKINKGKSHPGAFKILTSLFNELDKVVQAKDLTESDKKKILSSEITKYKTLKEQLIKTKPKKEEKEPEISPDKNTAEPADLKDLATAISEIKQLLKTEFKALRAELQSLRK
jgi:pilus assembly protein FimV